LAGFPPSQSPTTTFCHFQQGIPPKKPLFATDTGRGDTDRTENLPALKLLQDDVGRFPHEGFLKAGNQAAKTPDKIDKKNALFFELMGSNNASILGQKHLQKKANKSKVGISFLMKREIWNLFRSLVHLRTIETYTIVDDAFSLLQMASCSGVKLLLVSGRVTFAK